MRTPPHKRIFEMLLILKSVALQHPVLNLKPLHTAEIFDVVGDDDGVDASGVRGDHQVVGTDELALLFWSARISA